MKSYTLLVLNRAIILPLLLSLIGLSSNGKHLFVSFCIMRIVDSIQSPKRVCKASTTLYKAPKHYTKPQIALQSA